MSSSKGMMKWIDNRSGACIVSAIREAQACNIPSQNASENLATVQDQDH
jgi:hypothetical protein